MPAAPGEQPSSLKKAPASGKVRVRGDLLAAKRSELYTEIAASAIGEET